jgi:hypothetical protein
MQLENLNGRKTSSSVLVCCVVQTKSSSLLVQCDDWRCSMMCAFACFCFAFRLAVLPLCLVSLVCLSSWGGSVSGFGWKSAKSSARRGRAVTSAEAWTESRKYHTFLHSYCISPIIRTYHTVPLLSIRISQPSKQPHEWIKSRRMDICSIQK